MNAHMQVKNVYIEVNTGCCTDLVCSKCVRSYYWCVGGRCHCLFLLQLLHDKSLSLLQLVGEHRQDAQEYTAPESVGPQVLVLRHDPGDYREDERPHQDGDGVSDGFKDEFQSDGQGDHLLSPLARHDLLNVGLRLRGFASKPRCATIGYSCL